MLTELSITEKFTSIQNDFVLLEKLPFWNTNLCNGNSGTATSETNGYQQALIGGIAYGGYARKVWSWTDD